MRFGRGRLGLCLACAALAAVYAFAAEDGTAAEAATDWTRLPGVSATASNVGFWAGYAAEARFALDGDEHTYWSSTGGAVCCTESQPAWLLVSLGAARPLATLQLLLLLDQDLSYSLAVGNTSAGPFVTVAHRDCEVCRMNTDGVVGHAFSTHTLQAVVVASYVRVLITWSAHGGIGGCYDLCDWATNVYELRAYSPGLMPSAMAGAAGAPPPPPLEAPQVCSSDVVPLVTQADGGAGALLRGDAALQPRGDGLRGAAWVSLTGVKADGSGSVEFSRVVNPDLECGCVHTVFLNLKLYVRMGGGTSMPGEGLVISLVDASKQSPGATRFLAGCGTRPALPAHAISVVLDTSDSDPTCDEPSTGVRLVSTLGGEQEAPVVVVSNTLGVRTTQFRNGDWVPIQMMIQNINFFYEMHMSFSAGWIVERLTNGPNLFAPMMTWVDGVMVLSGSITFGSETIASAFGNRAANASMDAFYVVVSGRTGTVSSDAHAVSDLRLECRPMSSPDVLIENWDGYVQQFSIFTAPPPPASPLLSSPPAAAIRRPSSAALGGISFAITFCVSLGALGCVCRKFGRRHMRGASVRLEGVTAEAHEAGPLLGDVAKGGTAHEDPVFPLEQLQYAEEDAFDVFLSYRRADYWLADAVYDKLRLCGLRVYKDVAGRLAGLPFGSERVTALRAAPVFAPVITLGSLRRMVAAAAPGADADTTLGECLSALYLRSTGDVRLVHPLLAGEPPPEPEPGCRPCGEQNMPLVDQRAYADALAALPDAVPAATNAAVSAALLSAFGVSLPAAFAELTVRDIICGRQGAAPMAGVLSGPTLFSLRGRRDDLELYIRDRYAAPALSAAAEAAAARRERANGAVT